MQKPDRKKLKFFIISYLCHLFATDAFKERNANTPAVPLTVLSFLWTENNMNHKWPRETSGNKVNESFYTFLYFTFPRTNVYNGLTVIWDTVEPHFTTWLSFSRGYFLFITKFYFYVINEVVVQLIYIIVGNEDRRCQIPYIWYCGW